jgi:uncharacterized protein (DUF486 family)
MVGMESNIILIYTYIKMIKIIKTNYKTIFLWLLLNVAIVVFMDLSLFMQTTPLMNGSGLLIKIGVSELMVTIEWMFLIPANRIGNGLMSAPQISLWSYIFDFIGQILSNIFWLKLPTTIDDYVAMVMILGGMYISLYKVVG